MKSFTCCWLNVRSVVVLIFDIYRNYNPNVRRLCHKNCLLCLVETRHKKFIHYLVGVLNFMIFLMRGSLIPDHALYFHTGISGKVLFDDFYLWSKINNEVLQKNHLLFSCPLDDIKDTSLIFYYIRLYFVLRYILGFFYK